MVRLAGQELVELSSGLFRVAGLVQHTASQKTHLLQAGLQLIGTTIVRKRGVPVAMETMEFTSLEIEIGVARCSFDLFVDGSNALVDVGMRERG